MSVRTRILQCLLSESPAAPEETNTHIDRSLRESEVTSDRTDAVARDGRPEISRHRRHPRVRIYRVPPAEPRSSC